MHRLLLLVIVIITLAVLTACTRRMAPFAPHRTNTEAHRGALANQACLDCHKLGTISTTHQQSDNCVRCHRILQGE